MTSRHICSARDCPRAEFPLYCPSLSTLMIAVCPKTPLQTALTCYSCCQCMNISNLVFVTKIFQSFVCDKKVLVEEWYISGIFSKQNSPRACFSNKFGLWQKNISWGGVLSSFRLSEQNYIKQCFLNFPSNSTHSLLMLPSHEHFCFKVWFVTRR